jgi:oxygen-independent coproporphyrinogen-3 oxidase
MDTVSLLARHDRRLPRYTSYPTAANFDTRVNARTYRRWLGAIPEGSAASLYLHVPFCASLCWFCGCNTSVVHSVGALERYATAMVAEIESAAAAIGHRLPVRHIHWGGGTPTALPAPLMQTIDAALRRHFMIDGATEIAIELDPRTLPATAEVDLRALGIGRASLGVQDFSPIVQDAIGRHQSVAETRDAAMVARAAGARSINLDLVYGLPQQTVASLEATIASVLEIEPDRIALYGYAHVPWMQKRQAVLAGFDLPDAAARLCQQTRAAAMLVEAGYRRIGLDHFAKPDDPMAQARGTPRLRRNFQGYTLDDAAVLIGFGASAISALPQGYAQNVTRTIEYLDAIETATLATARGIARTAQDDLRSRIIERLMCDLTVDVASIADAAGMDAATLDDAWPQLEPLEIDGLIQRNGAIVTVTEAGWPFLRCVAACFDQYLDPQASRHAAAI